MRGRENKSTAVHKHRLSTVNAAVFACCRHKTPQLLAVFAVQALVRLLAWTPALILVLVKRTLGMEIHDIERFFAIWITVLLYFVLVMPLRFAAARSMKRLLFTNKKYVRWPKGAYSHAMTAGFIRTAFGLLWGAPFFWFAIRTYRYAFVLPGTQFNRDFTSLGACFAAAADTRTQVNLGMALFFAGFFLSGALFLYGWWRGMPFDFQPVYRVGTGAAIRRAWGIRRKARKKLWKNALVNLLICLPPLVIVPLIPYLRLRPLLTGKPFSDMQLIIPFIRAGMLADGTLLITGAAFVILYVPFLFYRKLRNAALTTLTGEALK